MARWFASVADGSHRRTAPEIFHPQFTYHVDPRYSGVDGIIAWVDAVHRAFPDQRPRIRHQVAEGDWVCTLFDVLGTHRGEFLGIPATGNTICVPVISYARAENGKLIEEWELFDGEGLRAQMRAT